MLLEDDSILTDDKDLVKTMNNYFINITKNVNLKPCKDLSLTNINGIASKFDNHTNIKKIKESFPNIASRNFNFEEVAREDYNTIIRLVYSSDNLKAMCGCISIVLN